jgi:hypothetical protein
VKKRSVMINSKHFKQDMVLQDMFSGDLIPGIVFSHLDAMG